MDSSIAVPKPSSFLPASTLAHENLLTRDFTIFRVIIFIIIIFLINPQRACAARVTVLGLSVCLSVCPSVRLSVTLSSVGTGNRAAYDRYEPLKGCEILIGRSVGTGNRAAYDRYEPLKGCEILIGRFS